MNEIEIVRLQGVHQSAWCALLGRASLWPGSTVSCCGNTDGCAGGVVALRALTGSAGVGEMVRGDGGFARVATACVGLSGRGVAASSRAPRTRLTALASGGRVYGLLSSDRLLLEPSREVSAEWVMPGCHSVG